jgi:hypothetical protein
MNLTQSRLHEVLDYCPETGIFVWKLGRRGLAKIGSVAGTTVTGGYKQIMVDGAMYRAHRLAWFYVHGALPFGMLDHINRDPSDNRIANLREATCKENRENISVAKNNTSGVPGVFWVKSMSKWNAKIGHNRRQIHLGYFENKNDAISRVLDARKNLYTHWSAS